MLLVALCTSLMFLLSVCSSPGIISLEVFLHILLQRLHVCNLVLHIPHLIHQISDHLGQIIYLLVAFQLLLSLFFIVIVVDGEGGYQVHDLLLFLDWVDPPVVDDECEL